MNRTFDAARNWRERLEAEQASQALRDARHDKNARVAEWVSVFVVVGLTAFGVAYYLLKYSSLSSSF